MIKGCEAEAEIRFNMGNHDIWDRDPEEHEREKLQERCRKLHSELLTKQSSIFTVGELKFLVQPWPRFKDAWTVADEQELARLSIKASDNG